MTRLQWIHHLALTTLAVVIAVKVGLLYDWVHEDLGHALARTEGPLLFVVAMTGIIHARRVAKTS